MRRRQQKLKQVKRLFVLDFIFRAYCSYGKFTLVLWLNRHKSRRNAFFLHGSLYLCLRSRIPIAQERQKKKCQVKGIDGKLLKDLALRHISDEATFRKIRCKTNFI